MRRRMAIDRGLRFDLALGSSSFQDNSCSRNQDELKIAPLDNKSFFLTSFLSTLVSCQSLTRSVFSCAILPRFVNNPVITRAANEQLSPTSWSSCLRPETCDRSFGSHPVVEIPSAILVYEHVSPPSLASGNFPESYSNYARSQLHSCKLTSAPIDFIVIGFEAEVFHGAWSTSTVHCYLRPSTSLPTLIFGLEQRRIMTHSC